VSEDQHDNNPSAEAQTFNLMEMLRVLDPRDLEVERSVGEGLVVRSAELGQLSGVFVEPCFPVTERGMHLLLKDADGAEIGMIEDVHKLDKASRNAVEAELNEQHFIPTIIRVRDISDELHIPVWQVDTDHGERRLELKRRHDVHNMGGGRIYIRDAAGNGYLIPDISKLDPASQQLVQSNS